jgi:hypothetical protein
MILTGASVDIFNGGVDGVIVAGAELLSAIAGGAKHTKRLLRPTAAFKQNTRAMGHQRHQTHAPSAVNMRVNGAAA